MSLIRQIVWLLLGVIVLALVGSVTMQTLAARETLVAELRVKNADNATSLALALSQQKGDPMLMELLLAAQFDTGHFRSIRLVDGEGRDLFQRVAPPLASAAPRWFVQLLPVVAPDGVAQVSDGWRAIGALQLATHTAFVHDALWSGALRSGAWLAAVGLAAGAVAMLGVAALRRHIDGTIAQARALQEGRFVTVAVGGGPEMRTLGEAMNGLVARLRQMFETQARQVDALRELAERDALTGLPNRRHFMALLAPALAGERGAAAGGLVMLRIHDLESLNRRHGRAAADAVLRTVGEVLQAYPQRIDGGFAGRLNGADFALFLPAAGIAEETAAALMRALGALLPSLAADAVAHAGAAELAGVAGAGAALAAADDALAVAEAGGAFAHAQAGPAGPSQTWWAEDRWRQEIDAALAEGRAELAAHPVRDGSGRLLHLECPLRLRLPLQEAPSPASLWLAHALRSRRLAALELRAVSLALEAIARDGVPRSVHVSLDSLATVGFVAELRQRLLAAEPRTGLLLELPERALHESRALLGDAANQWRTAGATVGIEHAGGATAELGRLYELGLGFVKVDRRHTEGIAGDAEVRRFATGLLALLHGMGLKAYAEGIQHGEDLDVLWQLGFDGATGPALPG